MSTRSLREPTTVALDRGVAMDPRPVSFSQVTNGVWLHWTVVEVDARMVPGSHGARCLLFTRQDCIRRVWEFPSEWRTLDAAALEKLSWHR